MKFTFFHEMFIYFPKTVYLLLGNTQNCDDGGGVVVVIITKGLKYN